MSARESRLFNASQVVSSVSSGPRLRPQVLAFLGLVCVWMALAAGTRVALYVAPAW